MSQPAVRYHQSSRAAKRAAAPNSTSPLFAAPVSVLQAASNAAAPPASTEPSAVCRRRTTIRPYRCSRCGKRGHNVRSCPSPVSSWFQQRCGNCGQTGHNARNCPATERSRCRVCSGTGRLPCSKCGGHVLQRSVLEGQRKIALLTSRQMDGVENEPDAGNDDMVGGCSVLQVRYAKRLLALQKAADVTAELQQSESHEVCSRCLGKGYLTCMACSSD